jgi:hypothetical protein
MHDEEAALTIFDSDRFGGPAGRDSRVLAFAAAAAASELSERMLHSAVRAAWAATLGFDHSPYRGAEWVGDGDIVVLDASPTDELYAALRDRGAHAVQRVDVFPARHTTGQTVDAFVAAWRAPGPRGLRIDHVVGVMPAADRVCEKSLLVGAGQRTPRQPLAVAWRSVLADVVHDDRGEHVGGIRRARPAVGVR